MICKGDDGYWSLEKLKQCITNVWRSFSETACMNYVGGQSKPTGESEHAFPWYHMMGLPPAWLSPLSHHHLLFLNRLEYDSVFTSFHMVNIFKSASLQLPTLIKAIFCQRPSTITSDLLFSIYRTWRNKNRSTVYSYRVDTAYMFFLRAALIPWK